MESPASDNSEKSISFLKQVPDFANYMISMYYHFNNADLFSLIALDKEGLASNKIIGWDLGLFTKLFSKIEKVPQHAISRNPNIIGNAEILKTYSGFFDWWLVTFSSINSISDEQFVYLENFYDKRLFARCFNFRLYPSIYKRYKEIIFDKFSSEFSMNTNFRWTNDFIYENIDHLHIPNLCSNSAVRINDEFLTRLGTHIDWDSISQNENSFWNYYFIEKYKDKLNWNKISLNKAIPWSLEFIERYEHFLDFSLLCQNPAVKWDEHMITRFIEKIDWPNLSNNRGINFDYTLIKKFESYLFWGATVENINVKRHGLSGNPCVIWNNTLLKEFYNQVVFNADGINVNGVIENPNFPWSIDILIDKYEVLFEKNKYSWVKLASNAGIWSIFKPYINDQNIKTLFLELFIESLTNKAIDKINEKERKRLETSRYVNFVLSLSESELELFYSAYGGDVDEYMASEE